MWLKNLVNPSIVIDKLYEESVKQLKRDNWGRAKRAKDQHLKISYRGIDKEGKIHFTCTSGTTKGKYYNVTVFLKDLNDAKTLIIDDKPLSNRDIMKLAMSGDISIHCSCPDFRYRFSYLAWTRGYGLVKETRFPKIRNRFLMGTVCKHSIAVLNAFPMYFTTIQSDLLKRGILVKQTPIKRTSKSKSTKKA